MLWNETFWVIFTTLWYDTYFLLIDNFCCSSITREISILKWMHTKRSDRMDAMFCPEKRGYNRSTQNIIENVFSPSHPLLLPQICFYSRRSGYSPRLVGVGQTIIHWTTASAAAFWQKREHPRGDVGATTITPEKPGPGLTISSSISHLLPGIRIQL